jgi:hypothetical protein
MDLDLTQLQRKPRSAAMTAVKGTHGASARTEDQSCLTGMSRALVNTARALSRAARHALPDHPLPGSIE